MHGLPFKEKQAKDAAIQEIESYGALAASLLAKQPARLIAVGGLSGTGKTLASNNIAPFIGAAPGAVHLRTDVERKIMYGVAMDAEADVPRDETLGNGAVPVAASVHVCDRLAPARPAHHR